MNFLRTCTFKRSKVKSKTVEATLTAVLIGIGIGPVMYFVNASDLQAVTPGNIMVKYADDT